ncbi:MAG: hypothetical protein IJS78_05015 [Clostridia bacterium]|nr:hypothetical protein [Clostridia bacterium]
MGEDFRFGPFELNGDGKIDAAEDRPDRIPTDVPPEYDPDGSPFDDGFPDEDEYPR